MPATRLNWARMASNGERIRRTASPSSRSSTNEWALMIMVVPSVQSARSPLNPAFRCLSVMIESYLKTALVQIVVIVNAARVVASVFLYQIANPRVPRARVRGQRGEWKRVRLAKSNGCAAISSIYCLRRATEKGKDSVTELHLNLFSCFTSDQPSGFFLMKRTLFLSARI